MTRRISGLILIAIGAVHLAAIALFYRRPFIDIVAEGGFDAVDPASSGPMFDREAAYWYLFAGLGFVLLGVLVTWVERHLGAPPAVLGWLLLGVGALGVFLVPVSGFWLFAVPAVLILRAR